MIYSAVVYDMPCLVTGKFERNGEQYKIVELTCMPGVQYFVPADDVKGEAR